MLSIFVAKVAAIMYLTFSAAILLKTVNLEKLVEDFENSPALIYISGFFSLLVGMILIEFHNFWIKDWTVLVTIIGWAATIKGIMLIAFPKFVFKLKPLYKNPTPRLVLVLVLGLFFGYQGFLS